MVAALPLFDELFAADGYIRVYQDVRGKYGSEGEYVMTRPLRGPLNSSMVDQYIDQSLLFNEAERLPNLEPTQAEILQGVADLIKQL